MFSSYFSLNCATMLHNASVHLVLTLLTMSTYYFRNCGFSVSFATTFDFCKSLQSGGESSRAFVLSTRFCSFLQGYYHLLCYYISSPTQLLDWSVFYKHFPLYSLCLYQQSLTSLIFSYQNASLPLQLSLSFSKLPNARLLHLSTKSWFFANAQFFEFSSTSVIRTYQERSLLRTTSLSAAQFRPLGFIRFSPCVVSTLYSHKDDLAIFHFPTL